MTQLMELLSQRDSVSASELLVQLKKGLAHSSAPSGSGAARQPVTVAVYQSLDGAALFCSDAQDLWSAGFVFMPAQQWDTTSAEEPRHPSFDAFVATLCLQPE